MAVNFGQSVLLSTTFRLINQKCIFRRMPRTQINREIKYCLETVETEMNTMAECDPVFSQVDKLLNSLNKSKLLHILMVLDHKNMPLHFTDIKKRVNSSSTTVTRRLKELEENGLVDRTVHSTVPITVKYSLTPNAKLLAPSIQSMYDWIDEQEIQFA